MNVITGNSIVNGDNNGIIDEVSVDFATGKAKFKFLGVNCVLDSSLKGDLYMRALVILVNAYYSQAEVTLSIKKEPNSGDSIIQGIVTNSDGLVVRQ
ncbi:hypothetical protein [Photorhabdus laumondii]|uniref:Uncharacterized protein n=1 Tax=Photorhabdus laumondii subsp. clarkei TaxID=2029685 RepID=A0A329VFB1_9GAMM|nr:hypothetical protein [Photorhabdus laumondii]PQQ36168.1 hypothetical protein C6H68_21015 [Photorhabdus luminescens]RAW90449.1 hypothetical protein CKY01_12795 [Photorhabdus laumondii subsp. clarkei]